MNPRYLYAVVSLISWGCGPFIGPISVGPPGPPHGQGVPRHSAAAAGRVAVPRVSGYLATLRFAAEFALLSQRGQVHPCRAPGHRQQRPLDRRRPRSSA